MAQGTSFSAQAAARWASGARCWCRGTCCTSPSQAASMCGANAPCIGPCTSTCGTVTLRSGVHSTQGRRGQGTVTSVRDKAAAGGTYVATATVVLSDFSAERLELPWAAAQEFLIAPPGVPEHLHTQRDALGQLSCYIPVKAPTSAARLCCPMANMQDVCSCTGKRGVVARCL